MIEEKKNLEKEEEEIIKKQALLEDKKNNKISEFLINFSEENREFVKSILLNPQIFNEMKKIDEELQKINQQKQQKQIDPKIEHENFLKIAIEMFLKDQALNGKIEEEEEKDSFDNEKLEIFANKNLNSIEKELLTRKMQNVKIESLQEKSF